MQIFTLFACLMSFAPSFAQKPGGFSDFDDEIILEDKKKTNKDLDFLDEKSKEQATDKKLPKKEVNDDELLNNLQSESNKNKKTDKQESSSSTRKRVIEETDDSKTTRKSKQHLENLPEDERAVLEEEQDQAEVEKEQKSKPVQKKLEAPSEQLSPEQPEDELQSLEEKQQNIEDEDIQDQEEQEEVVESPKEEPQEEPQAPEAISTYDIKGVEVERDVYQNTPRKKCNCKYDYLTPYTQRRGSWSNTLGIGYSTYHPTNYNPDFVTDNYETEYGKKTTGVEITFGFKKNMAIGAIALDIGANMLRAIGASTSTLTLITGTAALYYYMDNIWNEPYVVPYAFIGAGYTYYEERLVTNSVFGGTTVTYFGGGVQFQLDWLDDGANVSSYEEIGIENTFLFVEGRMYPNFKAGPSTTSSPDFSSSQIALLGGLKFEF